MINKRKWFIFKNLVKLKFLFLKLRYWNRLTKQEVNAIIIPKVVGIMLACTIHDAIIEIFNK